MSYFHVAPAVARDKISEEGLVPAGSPSVFDFTPAFNADPAVYLFEREEEAWDWASRYALNYPDGPNGDTADVWEVEIADVEADPLLDAGVRSVSSIPAENIKYLGSVSPDDIWEGNDEEPWRLESKKATNGKMYHVAPTRERESIESRGLNWPEHSQYPGDVVSGNPEDAIYLWEDLERAEAWRKQSLEEEVELAEEGEEPYHTSYDVWEVDTEGLPLTADKVSDFAWAVKGGVPLDRIRRIASTDDAKLESLQEWWNRLKAQWANQLEVADDPVDGSTIEEAKPGIQSSWHLSQHRIQWQPGTKGKGLYLREQGILWTWPVDENLRPTHEAVRELWRHYLPESNLDLKNTARFQIYEDGRVHLLNRAIDKADEQAIIALDPNLKPSEDWDSEDWTWQAEKRWAPNPDWWQEQPTAYEIKKSRATN